MSILGLVAAVLASGIVVWGATVRRRSALSSAVAAEGAGGRQPVKAAKPPATRRPA